MNPWVVVIFAVTLTQETNANANIPHYGTRGKSPISYTPVRQFGDPTPEVTDPARDPLLADIINKGISFWNATLTHFVERERLILAKFHKLQSTVANKGRSPFKCPPNQGRMGTSVPVGIMRNGDHLYSEEEFCSADNGACLFLRNDGNLVLYRTKTYDVLWESGTSRGHCSGDLANVNGRMTLFTSPQERVVTNGKPVPRIIWAAPDIVCRKYPLKDITPGVDLAFVRAAKEEDCCKTCLETADCKAYSWFSNTCWFKSVNGPLLEHPAPHLIAMPEDTSGMELTFLPDGHLCLKGSATADCKWSTRDASSANV